MEKQSGLGIYLRGVAVVLAVLLLLVVNREFSVADNGDFSRYMANLASKPIELKENWPKQDSVDWRNRFFQQPHFYWTPPVKSVSELWFTSASIFWSVGAYINDILFSDDVRSARYLGLLFFMFNLLALILFLNSMPVNSVGALTFFVGGFLLLVDARITSFYNSLYAESVPILAVLIFFVYLSYIAFVSDGTRSGLMTKRVICFVALVLALLAMFSKRQYLYFFIPSLFLVWQFLSSFNLKKTQFKFILTLGSLLIIFSAYLVTSAERLKNPSEFSASRITSYHALYYGVLPHAKDPPKLLGRLGLPLDSEELIGKSAWNEASLKLIADQRNINIFSFLKAIIYDPNAFINSIYFNAKEVGNFNIPLGMIYGAQNQYPPTLVSPLSTLASFLAGPVYFICSVSAVIVLFVFPGSLSKERRFASRLLIFNVFLLFVADIVISTFDGQQEARKHVFIASICSLMIFLLLTKRFIEACRQYCFYIFQKPKNHRLYF